MLAKKRGAKGEGALCSYIRPSYAWGRSDKLWHYLHHRHHYVTRKNWGLYLVGSLRGQGFSFESTICGRGRVATIAAMAAMNIGSAGSTTMAAWMEPVGKAADETRQKREVQALGWMISQEHPQPSLTATSYNNETVRAWWGTCSCHRFVRERPCKRHGTDPEARFTQTFCCLAKWRVVVQVTWAPSPGWKVQVETSWHGGGFLETTGAFGVEGLFEASACKWKVAWRASQAFCSWSDAFSKAMTQINLFFL